MRYLTAGTVALTLLLPFVLVGCGSSNRAVNTVAVSPSPSAFPFAGTFVGTYTYVSALTSPSISMTIDTDGQVTSSGKASEISAVSGTITKEGILTANFASSYSTFEATGTVAFAANGHLTGHMHEYFGSELVGDFVIDLTRQ